MDKIIGLTKEEASLQLKKSGYNEIQDPDPASPIKLIARQLKNNYIIYLLFFASLVSFITGETITGYTIVLVILMVIFLTFIQEYRAEKAIKSLKQMITPTTVVVRDGKEQSILSKELVSNDIVVLRTGDRIPADCIIIEDVNLQVNESVLTGESKEIAKSEKGNLYMGTFVVAGRCIAQVTHTGMATSFGKIVRLVSEAEKDLPLQTKINTITRYMVITAITISLLTSVLILLRSGPLSVEIVTGVLILAIALAVSAFPEGLPVVMMTTLAVGTSRMAKKNAIVNRMSVVETLGETTVICADKTGTITTGEMTVKKIFADELLFDVSGTGFKADGEFLLKGKSVDILKFSTLRTLITASVLCSDTRIVRTGEDDEYKVLGSPTEGALLVMAAKVGVFLEDIKHTRKSEVPFDSKRKLMSVLCNIDSRNLVFSKGAPEILLRKCKYLLEKGKKIPLSQKKEKGILELNTKLAQDSYRTLAIAYKEVASAGNNYSENDLVFLGIVGMEDPPREEVREALETCWAAGIQVKMITGDYKETAVAVAREIGLEGAVLTGEEMDKMTDEEISRIIGGVAIIARVRPEHKLRIVKILKQNGENVTMTGDGVNDAPALKEAHVGVAMGKNGTDVSRSAADLTLKDDNFATIVEAIREGRTIFNNIRKFVSYQLSCNFAELSILLVGVLLSPVLGWQVPLLLALQILFMNLVTDDLPALTLALNKSSKDVMLDPPKKKPQILNKPLFAISVFTGLVMATFTLGTYYVVFNILGQPQEVARTAALLSLILLEIANAFNFRSFRQRVLTRSPFTNIYLFYASVVSILATILIIYSPILNSVFHTVTVSAIVWLITVLISLLFVVIFDILKSFGKKNNYLKLA
ncbi:MAG: hypothetical protein A3D24_00130 [Candidatus Blackburnbacteria bacterium RIFCSPHIGHO2_02_FULL_39_13]|uniref:Cation-transporting P-type ATPase N-terminal domain-containing protein n=1 Tax=Candidatus Blackburnbacteria bacterium RIFCSPLOWO2_01_FULL_40_20 TaxID=1797519 RepID=A0A1G1VEU3_9BACT|nr:MAG: hypothetical protein A3D24_00130 [Candidatus Blackburnbacteria bacterium RIFCSPHIGHO2_02_FULL_39_13]OGY13944.1 MAG: hypothetical protein A3A77_04070 [Candidatus Blackburnbacteria bacterium RIFCSPLOWO2_01_FULL_40_20]